MRTKCTFVVSGALLLLAGQAVAQEEPGVDMPPPPMAQQPPAPDTDPLAQARSCTTTSPCPHYAVLLRYAFDPRHGPEAVRLLGRLGEVRAAPTLARVATYGQNEPLRTAAQAALETLVSSGAMGRSAVARVASDDVDPSVRARARLVVGGDVRASSDATPADRPPAEQQRRARKPSRVIFGPTALSESPGTLSWTVYNIAYHTFDYTLNEHLEMGIGTVVPVGIVGAIPRFKLLVHPTDNVHIGLQGVMPLFGIYLEGAEGGAVLFGGGPLLSLGSDELLFNASVTFGGIKPFGNDLFDETDMEWGMLPSFGGSWQAHRAIRVNVEVYMPVAGAATEEAGKVWLVLYGLRITGQNIFGDISFALPLFDGAEEILKYIPIGYPLLTFGYNWY